MTRIHDKIRKILEATPTLTQRGLAEKMGLNPAAVNRMLYGRRNIMAEEVPIIEQYLGQKLNVDAESQDHSEYLKIRKSAVGKGFSDINQPSLADVNAFVPVYSSDRKIIDWVQRHPAQAGIAEAFAFYVPSDDMSPRYFRGELVYLHPGRPAAVNMDCLIETVAGDWLLRRLLDQNSEHIHLQQFNPVTTKKMNMGNIKTMWAIVGRG